MSKFKAGDKVRIVNKKQWLVGCINSEVIDVSTNEPIILDFRRQKEFNGFVGRIELVKGQYKVVDANGEYVSFVDDDEIELYEETPKKIAVQCDTIKEWKAVIDKLLGEKKSWCNGQKSGYGEEFFKGNEGDCDCISIEDSFYVRTVSHFKDEGYTIIPAKEYLGKDVNEKKTATQMMYEAQTTPLIIASTPTISPIFEMYQEALNRIREDLKQQEQSKNKKPNKIKQMTNEVKNSIVDFAKNLSLSAEEKVLREVGLKDSDGDWNTEALDISLDLEAVSLGFKSAEEMSNFVPTGCELSKLEVARLLKKYEVQLLEIAKKMMEESKKK